MQTSVLKQHFAGKLQESLSCHPTSTGGPQPPSLDEHVEQLKNFLATAPHNWDPSKFTKKFMLPNNEYISCAYWKGVFHITGTDIIRALIFRFQAYGRPVKNLKKFEEGVFSDLRNLKPGVDATLENPRSEFLEMLYKHNCIRTQKKQKVFFWYSVPHEKLFVDALERDLKREALGVQPTTLSLNGGNGAPMNLNLSQQNHTPKRLMTPQLRTGDDLGNPHSAPAHVVSFDSKLLNIYTQPPHSQAHAAEQAPHSAHDMFGYGTYEDTMFGSPLDMTPFISTDAPVGLNSPAPHSNELDYSQLLNDTFYLPLDNDASAPVHNTPTPQPHDLDTLFHTQDLPKRPSHHHSSNSHNKYAPYSVPQEERFPCTFHGCNKRFKRFDLLQRHTKVHLA
jgi:hypothetical protein